MCVPSLCAARRGPMSGTKSGRKQGRAPLRSRSALCCLCQTTNETLAPIRAPLCWWIVKREMRREKRVPSAPSKWTSEANENVSEIREILKKTKLREKYSKSKKNSNQLLLFAINRFDNLDHAQFQNYLHLAFSCKRLNNLLFLFLNGRRR